MIKEHIDVYLWNELIRLDLEITNFQHGGHPKVTSNSHETPPSNRFKLSGTCQSPKGANQGMGLGAGFESTMGTGQARQR